VGRSRLALLDGHRQAAAIGGVAMALQLPALSGDATLEYACGLGASGPSKALVLHAADPTRALLGALLEAQWGVGPAHVEYDPHMGVARPNYLWAVGLTPFGPFSHETRLSFAYLDGARRARVYAVLEPVLERVHSLLHSCAPYGRHLDEVLNPSEHVKFVRRWNFFLHKLTRATSYLSMHNYGQALYYALSLEHDERGMRRIVDEASSHLVTSLRCGSPPDSWSVRATGWVVGAALVFVVTSGLAIYRVLKGPDAFLRGSGRGVALAARKSSKQW